MKKRFKVPYTAFKDNQKKIRGKLINVFKRTLDSGRYIAGPELEKFEKEFANYCNVSKATGLANGTCALHLTLRDLNLKAGDEVITAPNSFFASASSIHLSGAKIVFADVTEDLNIDPNKIEEAITSRTKMIIPVHLTGRPANMKRINEIAKKNGLVVFEDAAQSVGAKYFGNKVGSLGDIAAFSLHPLKNLHAYGDAGILVSNNEKIISSVKIRKNHGLSSRDKCEYWSFNCRLDELQAALLRVQLKNLDKQIKIKRNLASILNSELRDFVDVPIENDGEYHVYQTYVIKTDKRDKLKEFLLSKGIETFVHYPIPLHMQPAAKSLNYQAKDFPVALNLSSRILSLPLYPSMSKNKLEYMIKSIKDFF